MGFTQTILSILIGFCLFLANSRLPIDLESARNHNLTFTIGFSFPRNVHLKPNATHSEGGVKIGGELMTFMESPLFLSGAQ